jgi:hypothetical protein
MANKIYIKPSKRGTLRAALGTPKGQNIPVGKLQVKSGDSAAMKKKKIFAQNARKWNKENGGRLEDPKRDLRTASDSLTNANKTNPWIQRYLQGNELSIPDPYNPGSGKTSSHGLSYHPLGDNQGMIFPEIIQQGDSLVRMDNDRAREYATKNKTGITTDLELAKYYSQDGLIQHQDGGLLPEYAFGSWLKDNSQDVLGTAGALAGAIPVIGSIAGPILSGIGSLIGGKKAAAAEQLALDEETAAQKEQQDLMDRQTRTGNIVDQKQINYGATFENGGPIGQGFVGQPQITEYSNGTKHDESAIGGIPVDARGNPATTSRQSAVGLTEKGEVTWNNYVFSDKLKYDG